MNSADQLNKPATDGVPLLSGAKRRERDDAAPLQSAPKRARVDDNDAITAAGSGDQYVVAALYAPKWECVVCTCELGVDSGVVPCGITTCEPVMHMICLQCVQDHRPGECPQCKRKCGAIKPLPQLVDEQADPDAAELLNTVRMPAKSELSAVIAQSRSVVKTLDSDYDALVAKRVSWVVENVQRALDQNLLNTYGGSFINGSSRVPDFDKANVRLTRTKPGFPRISEGQLGRNLTTMARELQPHIDAIYEGSPVRVTMMEDQYRRKPKSTKFYYLQCRVSRR